MGLAATLLFLSALLAVAPAPAESAPPEFAPEPSPLPVAFRADFSALWSITDGQGLADHAGLTLTVGLQLGDAIRGRGVGLGPIVTGTFGVAEGGEFSYRIGGGAELVLPLIDQVELVPALLGGYLRSLDADERQGPFLKVGLGIRLVPGVDDFWLHIEPLTLVVLPPPPGGFTRYTSHVAVDVALVRFGGRTR